MKPASTAIIAALVVVAGILGFLYYDATKDDVDVKIDVPGVKIEGN